MSTNLTKVLTFEEFGFPKKKSAPQNLKLDFEFQFSDPKFDFEKSKIKI